MTGPAHLVTVELNKSLSLAAQDDLHDPRVEWVLADGGEWLDAQDPTGRRYDLVFADTWPVQDQSS
jgi:spermidine synthase